MKRVPVATTGPGTQEETSRGPGRVVPVLSGKYGTVVGLERSEVEGPHRPEVTGARPVSRPRL